MITNTSAFFLSPVVLITSIAIGLFVLLIGLLKHKDKGLKKALSKGAIQGSVTAIGIYAFVGAILFFARSNAMLPQVAFLDLNGNEMTVNQISQQRPVVIYLWESACVRCIDDMRVLQSAQASNEQVSIILLNQRERAERVARFVSSKQLSTSNVLIDVKGELAETKGLFTLPETLFYASNGELRYSHSGPIAQESLQQTIDSLSVAQ